MPTPAQISAWEGIRLAEMREQMKKHDHVVAVVVAVKLIGKGHTFDDEITGKRWVFNKYGELIKSRLKRSAKVHPWNPGLHEVVHLK